MRPRRLPTYGLAFVVGVVVPAATGCPAVFPELATRVRAPAEGLALDPPPPDDLRYLKFKSGTVPPRTRDGRTWDQVLGSLPDPYARLLVNKVEILRTPSQPDTLEPTWPDGPGGNFALRPDDRLRVELWDANPINDGPIGIREIGRPAEEFDAAGEIRVDLEGGGSAVLAYEPAHAMIGLGLWYELRNDSVHVTRFVSGSPADRAGLQVGDQILRFGDRDTASLSIAEIKSAFNSIPTTGLTLLVRHPKGATTTVTLREGPIYAPFAQQGDVAPR